MHIKAVALSLPTMGYWFIIHSHAYKSNGRAIWRKEDREVLERAHQLVHSVYANPKLALNDPNPDFRAFYNPSISVDEAISRTYPVLISAHRSNRSLKILEVTRDSVFEEELLAGENDPFGYRQVILHKGNRFSPTEHFAKLAAIYGGLATKNLVYAQLVTDADGVTKPDMSKKMDLDQPWIDGWVVVDAGNPERYVDMTDIKLRANPALVTRVRTYTSHEHAPLCHSGHYKIVMVPRELSVVIRRKKGGHEELQQAPSRWS